MSELILTNPTLKRAERRAQQSELPFPIQVVDFVDIDALNCSECFLLESCSLAFTSKCNENEIEYK